MFVKNVYDPIFLDDVYSRAHEMSFEEFLKQPEPQGSMVNTAILITYSNKEQFLKYAKYFDLMEDFKVSGKKKKL